MNKPYSETVRAFTDSAILAYECGYSEEGVRAALQALRSGSVGSSAAPKGGGGPAGGPPSPSAGLAAATPAAQGSTGLAAAAKAVDDLDENCCLACIAVVSSAAHV